MLAALMFFAASAGLDNLAVTFAANRQVNYEGRTRIETRTAPLGAAFTVSRTDKSLESGTAWRIAPDALALPRGGAGYAVSFAIRADSDWIKPDSVGNWINACRFHDAEGKVVCTRQFDLEFRKGDFVGFLFSGTIPSRAKTMEICFGVDMHPAIKRDGKVEVKNLALAIYKDPSDVPSERRPDYCAPVVKSDFTSPSVDRCLRVRYAIDDTSGVDWSSVAVTDSVARTSIPFTCDGNGIVLDPGAPWSVGCHRVAISVRDILGNTVVSHKVFLIGEKPWPKKTTLRDDGVLLFEGKPFFPIGIYGIKPHEFNGNSFGRAIADLRTAGFNAGHAYSYRWNPEFLSAAATNGSSRRWRRWTFRRTSDASACACTARA